MKKIQFINTWILIIGIALIIIFVYTRAPQKTVLQEPLNQGSLSLITNVAPDVSEIKKEDLSIEDKLIQKYNIIPEPGLEIMTMPYSNQKIIVESNGQDKVVFVEGKYVDVSQAAYRIYIKTINGDKVRIDDYPDNICHGGNFRPCLDPLIRPVAWTINDEKLIITHDYAGSGFVPMYTTFIFDPATKESADLATSMAQFSPDKKYVAYAVHHDNTPLYCYDEPGDDRNSGQIVIKEVESNNILFTQEEKNTVYSIIKMSDQSLEFRADKVELRDEIPCVFSIGQSESYIYDLKTGKLVKK